MPSRQCSDEDPWGEQLPRDSYPKDSAVGHANNAYTFFPGTSKKYFPQPQIPVGNPLHDHAERTTEWFHRASTWIESTFSPERVADCRHCTFLPDSTIERNVIATLFDDTPRDRAEMRMILQVIGFMRAIYPKPLTGVYYIIMRKHSDDPIAYALLILIMESLQRAFTRKGIRTRWWFHLDEQRGTGRYEHPHAWLKLDGYDNGFTPTEHDWVTRIIRQQGTDSLPVTTFFTIRNRRAERHADGPWEGDEIHTTATRFGLMDRFPDDSVPEEFNISSNARIVADSFTQYLEPINFEWGRTVQVFAWGLPDRTCFCHAPINSRYGPRDLLVVNGEMEE